MFLNMYDVYQTLFTNVFRFSTEYYEQNKAAIKIHFQPTYL